MKVKLKHELGAVTLTTPHNLPDDQVSPQIEIEASEDLKEIIKRDFERETQFIHGFYGHGVDINSTTNLDLGAALRNLPSFELVSIEPEIEPSPLPDGVQT